MRLPAAHTRMPGWWSTPGRRARSTASRAAWSGDGPRRRGKLGGPHGTGHLGDVLERRSRLVPPEAAGRPDAALRPEPAERASRRVALRVRVATARAADGDDEEARHLRRTVVWQEDDVSFGRPRTVRLLMMLADAGRWAGDWQGVSDAVDEGAVLTAERARRHRATATRAAISTMKDALWQVRPFGCVPPRSSRRRAQRSAALMPGIGLRARAQLGRWRSSFY